MWQRRKCHRLPSLLWFLLVLKCGRTEGWVGVPVRSSYFQPLARLEMATVGIFYGTSTGNTQTCAEKIHEAFGSDIAAEPVDIDSLEPGQLAKAFSQHMALVVGTPTWNTGADTERSGTGWDELYYSTLPELNQVLEGKKVAVFGLGDQVSYGENYADATGEMFDVFESLGCRMLGLWSQEGYEHTASKSIRGDRFCGLLLDMVNQEDLTDERVQQWVHQLKEEGILESQFVELEGGVNGAPPAGNVLNDSVGSRLKETLDQNSLLLDEAISSHSTGGFSPHYNSVKGRTMWTSPDGRQSFLTLESSSSRLTP